jgi:hypothetical protein
VIEQVQEGALRTPAIRSFGAGSKVLEVLFLILLPFAAVTALDLSLIDQDSYMDPAFYTGYGQSFERLWKLFGLTYYAARFPVMFLNTTSQWLSPGFGGYVLVRLLVFAMCAMPVYVLARRRYGPAVAIASYAFLILNPLLLRILCWDLTTFLSIPAGLVGITLWYLSMRRWSWGVFGAGFLWAVAINSHVFTGTAIGVFLGVELLFAVRRSGGPTWFMARAVSCAAGGLTCLAFGLLFYASIVEPVSAASLWRVTFQAIEAGQQHHSLLFNPLSSYYAVNYEIYVPVFTTGLAVVLNRHRLRADTLEARITGFAVAYLSAYAVIVFVLKMNILQFFWYFGHLTIVVYLTIPIILGRLVETIGRTAALWFTIPLAMTALVVSLRFHDMFDLALAAAGRGGVVVAFGILAAASIAATATRSRRLAIAGTFAAGVLVQVPFLSRPYLSPYGAETNRGDRPLLEAIMEYHALLNRYDAPGRRVRTWYSTSQTVLMTVAASNLMFTLQDRYVGEGMPLFGSLEREHIAEPSTRYVLLMDATAAGIDRGLAALGNAGVATSIRERLVWGRSPLVIRAVLVELKR